MSTRSLKDMVARQQAIMDPDIDPAQVRTLRLGSKERAPKRSTFVIEALLLFMCLLIVIAVSVAVVAFSSSQGAQAAHKEAAIVMATNIAERFSADPTSLQDAYSEGDYSADCSVDLSMDDAGSLYDATIVISWKGEQIYTLCTSKYVSHSHEKNSSDSDDVDRRVM